MPIPWSNHCSQLMSDYDWPGHMTLNTSVMTNLLGRLKTSYQTPLRLLLKISEISENTRTYLLMEDLVRDKWFLLFLPST
jgi:hypothetical protein